MHSVVAAFSMNTPLFAGGAHPKRPELRAPEIKAALRFWWRAMHYGMYASERARFVDVEKQLFGSADGKFGQGVSVSVDAGRASLPRREPSVVHPEFEGRQGARYLGYGLMAYAYTQATDTKPAQYAGQLHRGCLDPGFTFELTLRWRSHASRDAIRRRNELAGPCLSDEEFRAHLVRALKGFGLFGGLGSRSRRGFGSVTLCNLDAVAFPAISSPDLLMGEVKALLGQRHEAGTVDDVDFSAFSSLGRMTLVKPTRSAACDVLNAMGSAMVRYRSWGRSRATPANVTLNGEVSNKLFEDDHNWFRGGHVRAGFAHPDRLIFGLPQPYDRNTSWGGDEARRASRLFLHVHRFSDGSFCGLMFDLRSRFLPNGMTLRDPRHPGAAKKIKVCWPLLDTFLSGTAKSPAGAPIDLFKGYASCTPVQWEPSP